jgi:hypothetical protein
MPRGERRDRRAEQPPSRVLCGCRACALLPPYPYMYAGIIPSSGAKHSAMGVQGAYRFRRVSGSSIEENRQAGEQSPSLQALPRPCPGSAMLPGVYLSVLFLYLCHAFAKFRKAWWKPIYRIEKEEDKANLNHARPWNMDDLRSPLYLQALARHSPSGDPQFCAF